MDEEKDKDDGWFYTDNPKAEVFFCSEAIATAKRLLCWAENV